MEYLGHTNTKSFKLFIKIKIWLDFLYSVNPTGKEYGLQEIIFVSCGGVGSARGLLEKGR